MGGGEKVLFELYNTYFDGTVNSVVDTGIKLWDGTHNKFKLEVEYQREDVSENNITTFTCKPDISPYSGIRMRRQNQNNSEVLCISDPISKISSAKFYVTMDAYGNHVQKTSTSAYNKYAAVIIRNEDYIKYEFDGDTFEGILTDPKTNNLNLLIGCDYKGESETQRYYKGTIYKFKLTEL